MWNNKKRIFIVGIGGISLSAIAVILQNDGHFVSGSDETLSNLTNSLERKGIKVFKGHNPDDIVGFDILIRSAAISNENPQIKKAKELNIPIFERAKVVGMLSKLFKNTVSISGCHGKTTTTGLVSTILINAGFDPTVHIGGNLSKIGGNVRIGESDFFVTEACEYVNSFLELSSKVGIVLNVQADHLDFFKTVKRVESSFKKFAMKIKRNGALVYFHDDFRAARLETKAKKISFGLSLKSDYHPENTFCNEEGKFSFDCYENQICLGKIVLSIPGKHNILNALAAIATARFFGIDFDCIKKSIYEFVGAERRFQFIANCNGAKIIHDYAHHPNEIKATIATAKQISKNRVIAIFQPHTFTRTKSFFCAFAKALMQADRVYLYPIYPAREDPIPSITSDALAEKINEIGGKARCIHTFKKIYDEIKAKSTPGDVVLIMGAGNIVELCDFFKEDNPKQV